MKRGELLEKLKDIDCHLERHGASHDKWVNPKTGAVAWIPRHGGSEIPTGTALSILKRLGGK